MTSPPIKRLLVVGDGYGVPEILARVPSRCVAAIIAAEIRPQYHQELKNIAKAISVPFFIQPLVGSADYCDFLSGLTKLRPDSLICHSYSMLIRRDVLDLVSSCAFNVHMGLLPRNQGPNPIQWALIHGDQVAGVSLHLMDEGFDTGAIVDQEVVDILHEDTWSTLHSKVKVATSILLDRTIPLLINGNWQATDQDKCIALYNSRIQPESFEINFADMSDIQIYNLIRAQVAPLKGAYLDTLSGKMRFTEIVSLEKIAEIRKMYG